MTKPVLRSPRPVAAAVAAAAAALLLALPAHAANRALILWVGDYGKDSKLQGIDIDAANARRIAHAMHVSDANITEVSNASATEDNIRKSFADLVKAMHKDDKVFIYYSGHGAQVDGLVEGAKCTEGLVTYDHHLYADVWIQQALVAIAQKASQVVMMNDSCFSGGAATRALALHEDGRVPKYYRGAIAKSGAADTGYKCGDPVNSAIGRGLRDVGSKLGGPQVLYIAASQDNEVSFATERGSSATIAWTACLGADSDGSGAVNGEELRQCSQAILDKYHFNQHITLVGNKDLPLMFADAAAGGAEADAGTPVAAAPAAPPAASAAAAGGDKPPSPSATLKDLAAARDNAQKVELVPATGRMRIGKDLLDLNVRTNRAGYLYILQAGSDGQTLNLLFPNKSDDDNHVAANTMLHLPRDSWRVSSAGPAGKSTLIALLLPNRKDFTRGMKPVGPFATLPVTRRNLRNLVAEGTGAEDGDPRYGASDVVEIEESN